MSINGVGSGMSLVTRMQPSKDLQNAWIMFDHVKCVANWTTMVCHVYGPTYCKVMTIAVCDMQSKDTKAQQVMWTKLNDTMQKHDFQKPNFKGFMVDSAQANWNAVRIVYGLGDLSMRMIDKEHICLFH